MLGLVSLASGMIHGSKFEYVLSGIEKEDRSRVEKGLLQEGVITPPQFKQLIGAAELIYKKRAKSLSIFTSKKDFALLIGGACLAYFLGDDLLKNLSIWQGWTKEVPDDSGWVSRWCGDIDYHETTAEERAGYLIPVLLELGGTIGSCYMALRGYQCPYGSVSVENARLILEDLKKAERPSSSDLG